MSQEMYNIHKQTSVSGATDVHILASSYIVSFIIMYQCDKMYEFTKNVLQKYHKWTYIHFFNFHLNMFNHIVAFHILFVFIMIKWNVKTTRSGKKWGMKIKKGKSKQTLEQYVHILRFVSESDFRFFFNFR
jgi:hypothetical protein